jgi:hypothetical protein
LIIQVISFRMIANVASDKLTPERIEEMRMEGGRLLHEGKLPHTEIARCLNPEHDAGISGRDAAASRSRLQPAQETSRPTLL